MSQSPSGSIDLFHTSTRRFSQGVVENCRNPPQGPSTFSTLCGRVGRRRELMWKTVAIPLRVHRPFPLRFRHRRKLIRIVAIPLRVHRPFPLPCTKVTAASSAFPVAIPLRVHRPFPRPNKESCACCHLKRLSQSPSGSIDLFHHSATPDIVDTRLVLSQSPSGSIDLFHVRSGDL